MDIIIKEGIFYALLSVMWLFYFAVSIYYACKGVKERNPAVLVFSIFNLVAMCIAFVAGAVQLFFEEKMGGGVEYALIVLSFTLLFVYIFTIIYAIAKK